MKPYDTGDTWRRKAAPLLIGLTVLITGLMTSQMGAGRSERQKFLSSVDAAISEIIQNDNGLSPEDAVTRTSAAALGYLTITLRDPSIDPASLDSGRWDLTWATGRKMTISGKPYTVEFTAGPNHFVSGRLPMTIYFLAFTPILTLVLLALQRAQSHRLVVAEQNVKMAEETVASKNRFIASVSHELRTPLTAVSGFASELVSGEREFDDLERREMLKIIAEQSGEMRTLIEDLLTAARSETGNLTVRQEEFDLRSQVLIVGKELARENLIRPMPDPVPALGDRLRVRQVIRNLISNAARHGGKAIRVEIGSSNGIAWVTVSDNGEGIDQSRQESVFEPYVGSAYDSNMPGTLGLGLAVARQLAQMMNGDIHYEREDGWTRFRFSIPGAPDAAEHGQEYQGPPEQISA